MDKKVDLEQYKKLTDVQHCLARPGMYLGSTRFHTDEIYLYEEQERKFSLFKVTYNPGFIKLFDEIISNSVDEHKRNSSLNIINVTIDQVSGKIIVFDNGGIPVHIHPEHREWIPEMVFSNLKAGINFDDSEERIVAGTNGVGSTITNIYSKEFIVKTADGKQMFEQVFTDNMMKRSKPKITNTNKHFTEISFIPDYERFGIKTIDEVSIDLIRKRIIDIAACNPKLRMTLNGIPYKYPSFHQYAELYTNSVFYEKSQNWQIAIGISEKGFRHVSFVNSIETKDGGTHVEYIINQITNWLREKIKKKFKVEVKPSELRQYMFLFVECTIINSSFHSQTKEKLITPPADFGSKHEVSEKFMQSLFDSEIVKQVLDWVERKQAAEEKRELRKLNKDLLASKIPDLIDAKAKVQREKCVLLIFEGVSAVSAFRNYRDPNYMGAYPLRGKFINVSEMSHSEVIKNEEVKGIMGALGLKLGESPAALRYGKVYLYTDADPDGDSISASIINFFARYWPEMFEQGKIFKVMTPIVVVKNKKDSINFYSSEEYDQWEKKQGDSIKKWSIEYKKGLASLENEEYTEIIRNPNAIKITKDDLYRDTLDMWFTGDSSDRKQKILGMSMETEKALF